MTRRTVIPTASLVAVIAAVGVVATGRAPAAEFENGPVAAPRSRAGDASHNAGMQVISSDVTARFMALGVSKSVVIDLPTDIKDVLVTDKGIVDAVVRSKRRAYIIRTALGQTNVY